MISMSSSKTSSLLESDSMVELPNSQSVIKMEIIFSLISKYYQSMEYNYTIIVQMPIYYNFNQFEPNSQIYNLQTIKQQKSQSSFSNEYLTQQTMAVNGQFNIFQRNFTEPDRSLALSLFSFCSKNTEKQSNKKCVFSGKKQIMQSQIRKQYNDCYRNSRRQSLVKLMQGNEFFSLLQSFSNDKELSFKNISNILIDLRTNMNDYDFCLKLDQNNQIKDFILNLYLKNHLQISLRQKSLLVQSLIFLTYYGADTLNIDQRNGLIDMVISELENIKMTSCEEAQYAKKIIDLITNISADVDFNINLYMMDSRLFSSIVAIIQRLNSEVEIAKTREGDIQACRKLEEDLRSLRQSFIEILYNLSTMQHNNSNFFEFTIKQFFIDSKYLQESPVKVLQILSNYFKITKFRQMFLLSMSLVHWFQCKIPLISQSRFVRRDLNNNNFDDVKMTEKQIQVFYYFLQLLTNWIKDSDISSEEDANDFIRNNLNGYCLSQFLIQCSGLDEQSNKKSKNVSKAIQIYQFLASQRDITIEELLIITSKRQFQDVLKVLLDRTYFSGMKISAQTLSLINKMLSKNPMILKSLLELRIMESITEFASIGMQLQQPDEIINFLDLLMVIVASGQDIAKEEKQNRNKVLFLMQEYNIPRRIEHYQDHQNRQVSDKTEAFLRFLEASHDFNKYQKELQI